MNDFATALLIVGGAALGVYALNKFSEYGRIDPNKLAQAVSALDCQKLFKTKGAQCACTGIQIGAKVSIKINQLPERRF